MASSTAPSPPPSRAPPPPPVHIAATTFRKALNDLLQLTDKTTMLGRASIATNGISGLVHLNLEILLLSSSQAEPLAVDDLIHLVLLRSSLLSRNIPVDRLEEMIEQKVDQTLEEIEQSKTRRTVSGLDAILEAGDRLVHDMGFDAA